MRKWRAGSAPGPPSALSMGAALPLPIPSFPPQRSVRRLPAPIPEGTAAVCPPTHTHPTHPGAAPPAPPSPTPTAAAGAGAAPPAAPGGAAAPAAAVPAAGAVLTVSVGAALTAPQEQCPQYRQRPGRGGRSRALREPRHAPRAPTCAALRRPLPGAAPRSDPPGSLPRLSYYFN